MSTQYAVLRMKQRRRSPAVAAGVIAGIYLVVAILWIWLSDRAILWLFTDRATIDLIQSVKGSFFVTGSAAVIYFLVNRTLRQAGQTQHQLDLALRSGGIGLWDIDLATNDISLSDTWFSQLGYKPDEFPDALTVGQAIHPDDREAAARRFREYLDNPVDGYEQLVRFLHKDGSYRWILSRGELVRDADGRAVRIAGAHVDMTERKQAEHWLDEQNRLLQRLAEGHELEAILEDVCRTIEARCPGAMASIMTCDVAVERMYTAAGPSLPTDYLRLIDGVPIGRDLGSCGSAMARGEPIVCADLFTDPRWETLREAVAEFGLRSCWSYPIRGKGGVILGSFAVYRRHIAEPTPAERELIAAGAHLVGVAIQRRRADDERRQAEELYRSLVQLMPDGMIVHRGDEILFSNTAADLAMSGQVFRPLVGRRLSDVLVGEDLEVVRERVQRMLEQGLSQPRRELRVRRDDGSHLYIETVATPVDFEGRPAVMAVLRDVTDRKAAEDSFRRLVEGTTTAGAAFFDSLVNALTEALGARVALVGELIEPERNRVRVLAMHKDGVITHDIVYDLAHTPCENAIVRDACYIPDEVAQEFPRDTMLVEMNARAYIGVPLIDAEGRPIGILSVVHDGPLDESRRPMQVMRIFASRAAAELDRVRAEAPLDGDGPVSVRLVWAETGGPPVSPPKRHGLGSELIERAIPYELRGTAKLSYEPTGIVFEMNIPLVNEEPVLPREQSRVLTYEKAPQTR